MTAAPGSILIRPSRPQALKSTQAFYVLLNQFRQRGGLSLERIASVTDDKTINKAQNISKRIAHQTFSPPARLSILSYIFDTAQLLFGRGRQASRASPDALFFALLDLFDISDEVQDEARAQAVGTYQFWRHSAEHRGEFVFGRMDVSEGETGALRVRVRQVKRSLQRAPASDETFSGYMVTLPQMYFILLCANDTKHLRTIFLPCYKLGQVGVDVNSRSVFRGRQLHLLHLEGFSTGIDGIRSFQSPVHISLVDDVDQLATLDQELDIVRPGDKRVPDRVAQMLERNGELRSLSASRRGAR